MKRDAVALIEEGRCIGCTRCIDACPVDAIVGAQSLMHTVVESWCIGCGLCPPACPVDCIGMRPARSPWTPALEKAAAARARSRKRRSARTLRSSTAEERKRVLAEILAKRR